MRWRLKIRDGRGSWVVRTMGDKQWHYTTASNAFWEISSEFGQRVEKRNDCWHIKGEDDSVCYSSFASSKIHLDCLLPNYVILRLSACGDVNIFELMVWVAIVHADGWWTTITMSTSSLCHPKNHCPVSWMHAPSTPTFRSETFYFH